METGSWHPAAVCAASGHCTRDLVTEALIGLEGQDTSGLDRLTQRAGTLLETAFRTQRGYGERRLGRGEFFQLVARVLYGGSPPADRAMELSETALRITNRRCPVEQWLGPARHRCRIASRLLGSIAARNFGYAKVTIGNRCQDSETLCEFVLHLDAGSARPLTGDEYRDASARDLPGAGLKSGIGRGIVGHSPAIAQLRQTLAMIAPLSVRVLISGETGVGKELVARSLHEGGCRGPFVAANCGAIPEGLMESTLFGHERGAFTDAHSRRPGLFERAQGGTLFLDEVDALSPAAQQRLLRVLQEGEYEPVGGSRIHHSDARVLCATNQDLAQLVRLGRFRADLYYRINVAHLHVPPLRERAEDIPLLTRHILDKLARRYGREAPAVSEAVMGELALRIWPGNVRELENLLERSLLFCPGQSLDWLSPEGGNPDSSAAAAGVNLPWRSYRRQVLEREERRYLEDGLRRYSGNVVALATAAGLSRRMIYLKLQEYRLEAGRFRER